MQASEIISQVRISLVEPVAGFWEESDLLGWINRCEADYQNKTRIVEDMDTTSTQDGINKYPLPANCLSIRAVMYNDKTSASQADNWIRLRPSNLEKTVQENPNFLAVTSDVRGAPRSYFIWGREVYLFPCPNDQVVTDNLKMFYKAKPIPLSSAAQQLNLDDSLREAVIAYVLWKAWEKEQELEKSDAQRQIYDAYVREGRRWQKKQSGDQRYRLDISSPTPFEGPYDNRFNPLA